MTYESRGTIPPRYIVSSFGDGNYNTDGTSDETDINQAINDLTAGRDWIETVRLKGDFTIATPILIPSYTCLQGWAKITLADDSDCNMIENANQATHDVMSHIDRLTFDGNKDNNITSDGINWVNATQPSNHEPWVKFSNLSFDDIDDDAINCDFTGSSQSFLWIDHVHARFSDERSINLTAVNEGWITACHFASNLGSLFTTCGPLQIGNSYFNQQTVFVTCENTQLHGFWIDHGNDGVNCLQILGCQQMGIGPGEIRQSTVGGAGNDYAVYLAASGGQDSTDNALHDLIIGDRSPGGNSDWDYYIYENDADQDRNSYKDMQFLTTALGTGYSYIQGDAKLDFITMAFKPYNGAADAQYGVDVDAATEEAVAAGFLPPSVHEIVFVVLDAHAIAPAGQEMEIELHVDGGAGNQPWNTHSTTVANLDAEETNTAANDILTWIINSLNYANVRALTAGDRVRVSATYEVGAGGDTSTDAHFGSATLYYI